MNIPKLKRGPRQREFCQNGHEFTPENTIQCYARNGTLNGRRCVKCRHSYASEHHAKRRKEVPEKVNKGRRNSHMWMRYSIRNEEERESILASQNHKCAICEKTGCVWRQAGFNNNWHVDHDHTKGYANHRGILCGRCNTTLGYIEKVGLDKFSAYLEAHK